MVCVGALTGEQTIVWHNALGTAKRVPFAEAEVAEDRPTMSVTATISWPVAGCGELVPGDLLPIRSVLLGLVDWLNVRPASDRLC